MNVSLNWNLLKIKLLRGDFDLRAKISVADLLVLNDRDKVADKKKAGRLTNDPIILIVDNEPNILRLLYAVLSGEYQMVLKKHPMDAIHWLEEGNRPALVITEYNHRNFSGGQFVSYFKSSGFFQAIPIIILTDIYDKSQEPNTFLPGVASVIKKPFNPVFLKNTIKAILHEFEPATAD